MFSFSVPGTSLRVPPEHLLDFPPTFPLEGALGKLHLTPEIDTSSLLSSNSNTASTLLQGSLFDPFPSPVSPLQDLGIHIEDFPELAAVNIPRSQTTRLSKVGLTSHHASSRGVSSLTAIVGIWYLVLKSFSCRCVKKVCERAYWRSYCTYLCNLKTLERRDRERNKFVVWVVEQKI
jgi:hypothetical protein